MTANDGRSSERGAASASDLTFATGSLPGVAAAGTDSVSDVSDVSDAPSPRAVDVCPAGSPDSADIAIATGLLPVDCGAAGASGTTGIGGAVGFFGAAGLRGAAGSFGMAGLKGAADPK